MIRSLGKITALCIAVLCIFAVIGYSNVHSKQNSHKLFEQNIDKKLYNIVNPKDSKVALSSNPYDYIKTPDGSKNFKYIVAQKSKALKYMLKKFASTKQNGLEEYIMAIACSKILKENPAQKHWATGREWYESYTKLHK